MSTDNVNHPDHYKSGNLETIQVIEEFVKDLKGIEASDTANILKYACRWKRKNGVEDLKKLVWYANHLIDYIENKGEPIKMSVKETIMKAVNKNPKALMVVSTVGLIVSVSTIVTTLIHKKAVDEANKELSAMSKLALSLINKKGEQ